MLQADVLAYFVKRSACSSCCWVEYHGGEVLRWSTLQTLHVPERQIRKSVEALTAYEWP